MIPTYVLFHDDRRVFTVRKTTNKKRAFPMTWEAKTRSVPDTLFEVLKKSLELVPTHHPESKDDPLAPFFLTGLIRRPKDQIPYEGFRVIQMDSDETFCYRAMFVQVSSETLKQLLSAQEQRQKWKSKRTFIAEIVKFENAVTLFGRQVKADWFVAMMHTLIERRFSGGDSSQSGQRSAAQTVQCCVAHEFAACGAEKGVATDTRQYAVICS